MITGNLSDFEERCLQRGTTVDASRACIVSIDGDTVTVDPLHPAYPKPTAADLNGPVFVRGAEPLSFAQKAKNFAKSAISHVSAGLPMCSDEEVLRRHDICLGCEHYQDNTCAQCGCPITRNRKFISKLSWAGESCPVGKWGPASSD
jgi:hypothetical protein